MAKDTIEYIKTEYNGRVKVGAGNVVDARLFVTLRMRALILSKLESAAAPSVLQESKKGLAVDRLRR